MRFTRDEAARQWRAAHNSGKQAGQQAALDGLPALLQTNKDGGTWGDVLTLAYRLGYKNGHERARDQIKKAAARLEADRRKKINDDMAAMSAPEELRDKARNEWTRTADRAEP